MPDYIISVRHVRRGKFIAEPGRTRFLATPANRVPVPDHAINRSSWLKAVLSEGRIGKHKESGDDCGDITVFVHGYNTSPRDVAKRHRTFRKSLAAHDYKGAVVSFDWPSDDRAINYLEDRNDAKITALRLVDDCISLLAAQHRRGCHYNLHIVAHSMGSYVVREAFDDADDRPAIAASNWNVSQMCLVAADVSSTSMSAGDSRSRSLYRHCTRLTNYYNPYDSALKLSDIKRAGVAARAGRRGLPVDRPDKSVDVNCGPSFKARRQEGAGHSWYFDSPEFMRDLAETLSGDVDGRVTAKRHRNKDGDLLLA
jgi:esterase/lipase superfamily enzyme